MSVMPRTLRFRVVLMLLVAFLLSAGLFMLVVNRVVVSSHLQLESDAVTADVSRLRSAIEEQVADVKSATEVLAATPAANDATARRQLGIDFAIANANGLDASGKVVVPAPVAQALVAAATRGETAGLVLMPQGPAAVSVKMLPSGPFIAGRYMQPQTTQIAKLIQADLVLADPVARGKLSLPAGDTGVVPTGDNVVLGWTSMPGIGGAPALLGVLKEPRPIMQQAQATLSYVVWGISLLSLLVGLSIVVMLEGSVLHRLVRLRDSVIEFPDDADALQPVAAGSDEISDLAVALNHTLGRMKASEEAYRHDSRHDHLTGLANRRHLLEDADRILAQCREESEHACCTLVLLDLDGFKRINDDLGHQVGDEVLVWFAGHMRETLRADSTLCRLGGDEFAVLMPRTDRAEAEVAVERLREATSNPDDNPCFGMAEVHFSVGYAVAPDHGESLEMLSQCADTDLYANKRGKAERV